jgi:two-component system, cell cycle response regulator
LSVGAVIVSAVLPSMSGFEFCWEARLITNSQRQIYIILMSADYDRHKLTEALDSGADDFISEPPAGDELFARLRAAERMAAMQRELMQLATTDPLTGVLNRRAFFERAQQASTKPPPAATLSAIMIDIDHFKRINDVHGHGAGDEVIRGLAQQAVAEGSIVGRLGGEEFVMLLEGATLPDAVAVAERVRSNFAGLRFGTGDDAIQATCSVGVGEWRFNDSIDALLRRADAALYRDKAEGRNRVVTEEAASSGDTRLPPMGGFPSRNGMASSLALSLCDHSSTSSGSAGETTSAHVKR